MKKVKLGEICEIQAGGTPSRNKKEFWVQGNIPWVKIKDINSKYISKVEEHITELGLQFSSAKLFSRGTILYTIFATIGEVAILDIDAATNQAIAGLHLKSEKVLKDYLYFFLLSIKNRVKNDSRGVAQNNINLTYLKNIEVPIVENSIQQEICNNLTKINQIITQRNQQLIELSNLVKSRFNEMFGKNKRFESLDNLFDIIDGDRGKNYPKSDELFDEEYCLFLNAKNVTKNGFSFNIKQFITETKDKLLRKGKLERHDIVLTTRGTIGNVAYYDESISYDHLRINSGMVILRAKKTELNRQFILYVLKDDNYYKRLISGSAQPQLPITKIKKILLPLPPLSLQNEFADFVAQVDKSQLAIQKSLEELETLKKSLMQEYFG
ncbi:restriction endonuclease subunit S [Streptococcus oralis]|uniref:restriction endonuclease subunit S n=1 Tax=Streptococcus oralis TaxID=1303 RepID=UPI001F207CFC|nr:restriction endonuclease subunit S [Streptococcus oralis]UJD02023.1 restriction endonuclease subunit S [Streptococcus oralis]